VGPHFAGPDGRTTPMNHCTRCAGATPPPPDEGTLCLAPPLAHTTGSLRELLRRSDLPFHEPAAGVLAVPLGRGRLGRFVEAVGDALSAPEQADTRSVLLAEGAALAFSDLARMQPLADLVGRVRGAWLPGMLAEGRLTTHFQPIVHADDPETVFAHECLTRGLGADGGLVPPLKLYEAARGADLVFQLDRAARLTAIREAARIGLGGRLFINFNPTSIYDPVYCLRSTTAAVREAGVAPGDVVFEVVESDRIADAAHLRRITEFYREAGFRVALDDLGSGYGSLNLLTDLRPDFVKLDMQLIRGVDRDPFKAAVVAKLLEMARDLGVATVAEGVETEAEWSWVRRHGADYAQGYLFARPASPPARPTRPRAEAEVEVEAPEAVGTR